MMAALGEVPQKVNKARCEIEAAASAAFAFTRSSHILIKGYSPIIKLTVAKDIGVDKYKWQFCVFHELSHYIKDLKKCDRVRYARRMVCRSYVWNVAHDLLVPTLYLILDTNYIKVGEFLLLKGNNNWMD